MLLLRPSCHGLALALLAAQVAVLPIQAATPSRVPAPHGEEADILPHKGDRSYPPALEAYRLLKDQGLEIPRELALQVNASLTVNPVDPADRQAGGSPGTALVIPATGFGDTWQDAGTTLTRSNYLSEVPGYTGSCLQAQDFGGNDAWYTFTLTQPTRVQATTCGGVSSYDTVLGILMPDLLPVATNDDACGGDPLLSSIDCCLEPGSYHLVVDGYAGASGDYGLTVEFQACAPLPGLSRGGPDAFGYTWISSSDATGEGPDFNWLDIRGSNSVALGDNDATTAIPLGFTFPYYGNSYTTVRIGSNGVIGFSGSLLGQFTNQNLPSVVLPNNLIAAFWDDLAPNAGGQIHWYSDPDNGRFIVQFTSVPAFATGGLYTFQVILHRGGDIVINYLDMADNDLAEATIGIENSNGTVGLTANFNGTGWPVGDYSAIRFGPPRPTTGGPDAFGYAWQSSDDPAAPPAMQYPYGSDLGITGDDVVLAMALPFPFPFYSLMQDTVYVTSNGWLGFSPGPAYAVNSGVPDPAAPNNGIYVLFDGYHPPYGGFVKAWTEENRAFVIHWNTLHADGDPDGLACDFQVMLFPDGRIQVNLKEVSETLLASVTVGIENATGTDGLQIAFDGAGCALHDNQTIRITPPAPPRPTRGESAGYAWRNSFDAEGPRPMFEDISSPENNLGIISGLQTVVRALPFPFPWNGGFRDSMVVTANGWLSFDTASQASYTNRPLPTTNDSRRELVCPFWDNLWTDFHGDVYYRFDPAQQRVIVQWHQVEHRATAEQYTFQVMLYANGEIYFNYLDMEPEGATGVTSASVGLEFGVEGVEVNYNDEGCLLANGTTIHLYPVNRKPAAITDLRIVQDAVPVAQPFLYHYEWSPVTTDIFGNSLAVDHYDLYFTLGPDSYAPFPQGWIYYFSFSTPYTGTIEHYVDGIRMRVVAVDTNGMVVTDDRTPGTAPLRAETLRSLARQDDGTMLRLADEQPLK